MCAFIIGFNLLNWMICLDGRAVDTATGTLSFSADPDPSVLLNANPDPNSLQKIEKNYRYLMKNFLEFKKTKKVA